MVIEINFYIPHLYAGGETYTSELPLPILHRKIQLPPSPKPSRSLEEPPISTGTWSHDLFFVHQVHVVGPSLNLFLKKTKIDWTDISIKDHLQERPANHVIPTWMGLWSQIYFTPPSAGEISFPSLSWWESRARKQNLWSRKRILLSVLWFMFHKMLLLLTSTAAIVLGSSWIVILTVTMKMP